MDVKYLTAPLELKQADGEAPEGAVLAAFSIYNVIDSQQDVVLPGAIRAGQIVPMVPAHDWHSYAIGEGVIEAQADRALYNGQFFTETTLGRDWYLSAKRRGPRQQWSFGFKVVDAEMGEWEGHAVRLVRDLELFEVSPVLVGANRQTATLLIKGACPTCGQEPPASGDLADGIPDDVVLHPFANEHACRLHDPGGFQAGSFRRVTRESDGKTYAIIMGRRTGETAMTEQAYRYPSDSWTVTEARAHCRGHAGIGFEAATGEKAGQPQVSRARRERLAQARALLDELLAETEPKPKDPDPDTHAQDYALILASQTALLRSATVLDPYPDRRD